MSNPVLIALDSGTSVVKAVAFTTDGREVASASRPNRVTLRRDGGAEQDMEQTWQDAADALRELSARIGGRRPLGLAVTGQGDGTWLVDAAHQPVGPAWLWLDARAAPTVERLRGSGAARAAFVHTGTGLSACNMSAQLLHMPPDLVSRAAHALHCKDWLHLCLTGIAATDPSEACFTWGSYRTRDYSPEVLDALDAGHVAHLLPPVLDGTAGHTRCWRRRRRPGCPLACLWCWRRWTSPAPRWAPGCTARRRARAFPSWAAPGCTCAWRRTRSTWCPARR